MHAAYVCAPGQIQENTPGELFMYWFRARGYLTISTHPKGPKIEKNSRSPSGIDQY